MNAAAYTKHDVDVCKHDAPIWARPLAKNLRYSRLEANLSQGELAKQAGVHLSFISHLENGIGNPTLRTLHQLAEALGTAITTLLEEA